MSIETIFHSLIPIKYSLTAKNGIAIIYYIKGWQNVKAIFSDINIKFKYIINKKKII